MSVMLYRSALVRPIRCPRKGSKPALAAP